MSSAGQLSELDLLRGQVADLSRQLAERDRSMQDLRERSQLLRTIVEDTASGTGDEFFASLVRHLTSTLHVQYAVISEVLEVPFRKIRTLAVSAGDTLIDNFEYDLDHTPCATALTQTIACFNRDLQATFPEFQRLVDLGAESYCAVPIRTKDGEVRGLLVVMDTKPLQHGEDLQFLLEVFAPRVGAEFERRRVEQEHAMALAEIHNVIETVPDILFTLDTHGNMVKWNRRVENVTGYSPEELLSMPALAFVPPEEHIPTAAAIERAFTEGYAELEGHLLTKENRLIPYYWTGALLKNSHGEPIGIIGIGRDVSGKRLMEEALRESEQRFALAVEGSNDILWDAHRLPGEPWYAPQTRIWWSSRVRELLGLQESDSFETLEQWVARLHPDDKDRVFGQLAAHIEQRVPYDVEYRLRTNAGHYRWIRGRGQALWDEQGEPSRMSGSCQDITERKGVDEALRASEERWHLAVRGSNDGIWDWDIQSGTIFFSPRWKAMRGFGEYEITSHVEEWQSRIHPDDLDRVLQNLNAYMSKQTPVFCEEYRTQRKDGSYMWILDRGLALWAEGGTPVRMVGSESDITEHKLTLLRLAEQESLLRAIHDTDPECVSRVADDGTILQMNRAGLCFIESDSFDQVAGRSVYDLVAPEFLEQYHRMHEAVIRGASQRLEFQIVGLKGTRRWMETHAVPLLNPVNHRTEHLAITRDITEHKRAEEALRESEERFRTIVEASPIGIFMIDPGGSVTYGNAADLRMTGLSREDTLGTRWIKAIHPEDREQVLADWQAAMQQGKPYVGTGRYLHEDGTIVWWDVQTVAVRVGGRLLGHVGMVADITGRKQAEESLLQSWLFLQSFVEHTPAAVAMLDRDLKYVAVSKRWYQDYQLSERSIIGLHHYDVFPEIKKMEHWQAIHRRCLAGEILRSNEDRLVREDGKEDWLRWEIRPWMDAGGSIGGIIIYTEVITERKQAEVAMRESEERLRLSLEAANQGIYDLNVQTGEALVSSGYASMLGYDPATFHETNAAWIERLHPDDRDRVADYYRAYVAGEIPEYRVEFRQRTRGGDWRWILSLGRIVERDARGEPLRMLGTHTDITERKQTEEALRASEDRFNLAVRGSNTGIWDWDLRTGKTYFSPLWKSMLGYEEHELRGELFEWEERLHPDDRKRSSATVRAYLEGATAQYELEHRLRHKDGSYRWIMARGVSICDTEGKPYRMAGSHIDITEQKQTQEALAQSESQLRTVLDALPVGVWFTDRSGKLLLANPAAKQIWSNIEKIGLQDSNNQSSWWETIGSANAPHRWALSQVLTTGVPSLNEAFDFECLDGTKKTIRNSTVPVISENGVILGAIVLNEDITVLRGAQAALQLTQFSVDHAIEGFLWIGSDARIFHGNDSICRMLEYTWEELTAMTLYDIDPKLSSEVWPAHWEELKQKGSLTFESKYWSRTGRVLDMEVTVNYLQYEGKEYNCAIMRDISERKQAEEALRASEGRYRSLYDDTPIMYFTLATDGTMRSVNRFGAEQLGYQVEELIGHSVLGLFHESDREAVAASLSECLATPETTRYWEFRKLRKDGSMIWVREAARVGRSDTEETVVLVTCEDITERKQAEHESRERTRQVLAMQAARLEIAHLDDTRRTFSEVLSQVTRIVANTLAVERVSLWLLSEDQTELVCQDLYLRSQATHSAGSRLAASSYPRYLAVLKESLVIGASNARVDQRTSEFADDYFFALGITSVLDVPIRRQGKLVGVLWCEHVGMPREWAFEAQDFGASVGQTIVRMMEASERTQAEDRLRATQYAVDHATDYIFVIGSNGYFLDVNKSACRRLGYTKDELLTKSVMDIDPDFPPAVWESFWEEIKHKKLLCLESRHRSKSGEIYPVEVIANYILHEGKELDYAFVRDITERKRAEKELQKSYSFLRQVIDLDPNFIFAKDREGRFTLANKAVADAYGTTAENLIGKTDSDFNPNQEEVAFFRQDDLAVIDTLHELFLPEEVITGSDGRTRWLQTVKRPILDDGGCAIMVLGSSTDISERKRIEETLRQRERDLQAALHDRERISQDLHDGILQSLFAVGLALESAKLTMPPRKLKMTRAALNQAIDQLNDVMREIRHFIAGMGSDLLQGKDLPAALKQMLASLTEHQATRVRLAVEDRAAKALSTEQSLHLIRVIQEAVSNCVKHGHAQEARVSLKMLKRGVRLRVRDNGRGFNQGDAKRTGHGLANMAARARQIGGRFTILSKVNEGTSIVLDFPKEAADVSR